MRLLLGKCNEGDCGGTNYMRRRRMFVVLPLYQEK